MRFEKIPRNRKYPMHPTKSTAASTMTYFCGKLLNCTSCILATKPDDLPTSVLGIGREGFVNVRRVFAEDKLAAAVDTEFFSVVLCKAAWRSSINSLVYPYRSICFFCNAFAMITFNSSDILN